MKLGKLPRDTSRYAPVLEDYLVARKLNQGAGLEKVRNTEDVDRASKVTSWPVYKNDSVGDCTIAGMAHAFTAMGVAAGYSQSLFTDDEIIRVYSDISGYNPNTGENDNGCEMQDVLKYMRDYGMTDANGKAHKVAAYASLGVPTDTMMLSEVLKTFGAVYVGIDCPQSAEDQFGNAPWTYEKDSPILGGHAITLHRRQPYGSMIGVFDFSTWGALQSVTIGFIDHYVTEAWAFLTPDWLEVNGNTVDGLSLSALQSDMSLV